MVCPGQPPGITSNRQPGLSGDIWWTGLDTLAPGLYGIRLDNRHQPDRGAPHRNRRDTCGVCREIDPQAICFKGVIQVNREILTSIVRIDTKETTFECFVVNCPLPIYSLLDDPAYLYKLHQIDRGTPVM